jgi:hypothetical protein
MQSIFFIYAPIQVPGKNAITFLHDPGKDFWSFWGKVMPILSCDGADDYWQNQAQVTKSIGISGACLFKVKKNADHCNTQ